MKGSYLTDRYIRRMQQGGGIGVFAPNPNLIVAHYKD